MPDKSVTSGTGLAVISECRCRTDAADYRPKYRCFYRHSGIYFLIFQHLKVSLTPPLALYRRAGCLYITSSIDVQGVYVFN